MKTIEQAVHAAFTNIVASGAIEQAIEKKIGETIASAVEEQFRSYSDFGKALKEQVAKAVQVDLASMDFPSYADLVMKIIRRQVDASMKSSFTERLEKDMAELLAPAPAEITLEKLVDDFIEEFKERHGNDRSGEEFTLRIEQESASFTYIALDKEPDQDKYRCDFRIGLHNGAVFTLQLGGADVKDKLFIGPLHGFERTLFQLYAAKSKIVVPIDACASDYPNHFPYND